MYALKIFRERDFVNVQNVCSFVECVYIGIVKLNCKIRWNLYYCHMRSLYDCCKLQFCCCYKKHFITYITYTLLIFLPPIKLNLNLLLKIEIFLPKTKKKLSIFFFNHNLFTNNTLQITKIHQSVIVEGVTLYLPYTQHSQYIFINVI